MICDRTREKGSLRANIDFEMKALEIPAHI